MLALPGEGPRYGLRLREEFEDRTGEVWPLNAGQVYATLRRLERGGLAGSGRERRGRPAEGLADHLRWRAGAGRVVVTHDAQLASRADRVVF